MARRGLRFFNTGPSGRDYSNISVYNTDGDGGVAFYVTVPEGSNVILDAEQKDKLVEYLTGMVPPQPQGKWEEID